MHWGCIGVGVGVGVGVRIGVGVGVGVGVLDVEWAGGDDGRGCFLRVLSGVLLVVVAAGGVTVAGL